MFETLNPIFVCVCRLLLSLLSSCRSTHHTIIHGPHIDAVCPVLSEEAAMSSSCYITTYIQKKDNVKVLQKMLGTFKDMICSEA